MALDRRRVEANSTILALVLVLVLDDPGWHPRRISRHGSLPSGPRFSPERPKTIRGASSPPHTQCQTHALYSWARGDSRYGTTGVAPPAARKRKIPSPRHISISVSTPRITPAPPSPSRTSVPYVACFTPPETTPPLAGVGAGVRAGVGVGAIRLTVLTVNSPRGIL
ncbi:hypothetical protein B0H17DRAFT_1193509 [Mycena rosella]|uniref:Uncharacterized protein n=1 Tax=Mycena rosella TaxID=1033263 RepID=A0AAD7M7U7_MYCRO|nr:hypothetical protein B0H17DRAFT_1193509 [Mycena rosella]